MTSIKSNVIWPLVWFIGTPVFLALIIVLFFVISNTVVKEERPALHYSLLMNDASQAEFAEVLKTKSVTKSIKFEKNTIILLLTDVATEEQLYCLSTKKGQLDCWLQSERKPTCESRANSLQNFLLDEIKERSIAFSCKENEAGGAKSQS